MTDVSSYSSGQRLLDTRRLGTTTMFSSTSKYLNRATASPKILSSWSSATSMPALSQFARIATRTTSALNTIHPR